MAARLLETAGLREYEHLNTAWLCECQAGGDCVWSSGFAGLLTDGLDFARFFDLYRSLEWIDRGGMVDLSG